MKRVFIILILLSFSSIIYAQEKDEFNAFNFIGKMPVVQIETLGQVGPVSFYQKDVKFLSAVFPNILAGFLINSVFPDNSWNQSEYVKEYIRNNVDNEGQLK